MMAGGRDRQAAGEPDSFSDRYWRVVPRSDGPVPGTDQPGQPDFRLIADSLPTLCWIADADGYITWYNRRWHNYCGTTPEQMEGWGWQAVHDPAVLPDVMARWTASIASGEPFEMVFPLRGADGLFRPFLTRIVPSRDAAGAVRNWIGTNVEIGQQVAIERELRRSQDELQRLNRTLAEREAFLSSVLASSTDCIKVLDLQGKLTFMSEGGQRVMAVSDFNAIAGCPWPDFWAGIGNEAAVAAVDAAARGEARSFVGRASTMAGMPR
jgi:PAS domain S-box-containing protein